MSASQFSRLREDKKHLEMMVIIEKDNLDLRQVTACVVLKGGLWGAVPAANGDDGGTGR